MAASPAIILALLSAVWFGVNAQRYTAAVLLGASTIMTDFGITAGPAGLLAAAYFPIYGLLQVPAGLLVDRLPPRAILLAALTGLVASNLMFAAAPSIEWAVLARGAVGFSAAPVWLAALKTFANLSLRQYPRRVGLLVTVAAVGQIAIISGLPFVLSTWSWRTATLALTIPLLILVPMVALAHVPASVAVEHRALGALLSGLGAQFRSRSFWWLMLPAAVWNGAHFGVLAWLARFSRDVLGSSSEQTGLLPAMLSVGLLFGGVLFGSLQSRWRPAGPWLFFGGGTAYAAAVGLIPVCQRAGLPAAVYLLALALGVLFGAFFLWIGLLSEFVPRGQLATATGLINGLTFLPAFIDPWLFGTILDLVDRPALADPTYSADAFGTAFSILAATMGLGLLGGALAGRARPAARSAPLEAS